MPTQRYDAPSGKARKRFVVIVSVELDKVCGRNRNAERVIVFQYIILQRAQGINNSAQIWKQILFRLDYWNRESFDKLMKDTNNSAMEYLGKARRIQT